MKQRGHSPIHSHWDSLRNWDKPQSCPTNAQAGWSNCSTTSLPPGLRAALASSAILHFRVAPANRLHGLPQHQRQPWGQKAEPPGCMCDVGGWHVLRAAGDPDVAGVGGTWMWCHSLLHLPCPNPANRKPGLCWENPGRGMNAPHFPLTVPSAPHTLTAIITAQVLSCSKV